jgi:hypothetical protein
MLDFKVNLNIAALVVRKKGWKGLEQEKTVLGIEPSRRACVR